MIIIVVNKKAYDINLISKIKIFYLETSGEAPDILGYRGQAAVRRQLD